MQRQAQGISKEIQWGVQCIQPLDPTVNATLIEIH